MSERKRLMIFIDRSNLYHALKECRGNAKIDFAYMVSQLTGENRELVRVYYYNPRNGICQ